VKLGRLVAVLSSLTCAGVACEGQAFAGSSSDDAIASASIELSSVGAGVGQVQAAVQQAGGELTPEQRLANGELLFRNKDFAKASVVLSETLEAFPNTPSYPDALWLRGETYYAEGDYLAARRDYRALVDRGAEPRFQIYLGKAIARLVDVSLRLNDPPELFAPLIEKFSHVPSPQVDAALLYAKGKAYFKTGAWNDATGAFAQVANGTQYAHQARYFQGLIAMKLARSGGSTDKSKAGSTSANYKPAIDTFRAVTDLPADTPDHEHVIDLAWLAIGRLFYEMEQYQQASEAYAKVGRGSPEFDAMLFELSWVYVRAGDVERAERALEVLEVSNPDSEYVAESTLLQADLLLRAGAFDRALQLYDTVRSQYEPMSNKVAAFLDSTKDVSVYYERLRKQQLDALDQGEAALPPIAVRWAREIEDGPLAFTVIDDVNECKTLLKHSTELIDRLTTLSTASTRVRAFKDLASGEETALGLLNRVSRARLLLAHSIDKLEPDNLSGEIGGARQRRRALMASIEGLPVNPQDFAERDRQGDTQWNTLSQALTQRQAEVDSMQATVNGLRRVLADGPAQGVALDPASVKEFQTELEANEHDLKGYKEQMAALRHEVEAGRAQIGLGDARYQSDAGYRDQFRDVFDLEVRLASTGGAGGDAQGFAARAVPVLMQARQLESQLVALVQQMEVQVDSRAEQLRQKIETERANVAGYQQRLDALDGEARDLVGHVAERNFTLVRDRLRGIVLRADVGITEQAWEVREEELDRVRNLQGERARQDQLLDEELKEVRDDGVEPGAPSK
jgi:tetratricopeptide (TPR) repeat protein